MSATTLSRGDICILRVVAALSMALTASPSNAAEVASYHLRDGPAR